MKQKAKRPERDALGPVEAPARSSPLISFREFTDGSTVSGVLLAGAHAAIRQDGQPRKRTREDWEHAVTMFATSPAL